MKRKQGVLLLALCLIWIAVILLFSSRNGDESHGMSNSLVYMMGSALAPDFSSWSPTVRSEWMASVNQLMRKLAHFVEYGLLGVLAYLTVRALTRRNRRRKPVKLMRKALYSFYPCLLVSALDEFVQMRSAGRNASPWDVVLDCAGVIVGIALCIYKTKAKDEQESSKPAARRRA